MSKARQVAKYDWLSIRLEGGSPKTSQQKSVCNDLAVHGDAGGGLCLDGALCTERQVVHENTNKGSHHLSRDPRTTPCSLEKTRVIIKMGLQEKMSANNSKWIVIA